jgi:probable F420-dependent oxidoreductase
MRMTQPTSGVRRPFRFGLQVEQAPTAAAWRDLARQAEDVGFDVLLMPDHFGDQFSPFAGLAAAAAATSTLRLGTLVIDNDFRQPLVLAKESATLDVVSDGRLELGLGAGWDGSDYSETGIPFDEPAGRVARLAEAVAVLKGAFAGEPFSHQGEHYQVNHYRGAPAPVQRPHPPLMIGAGSPRLLALAAREAQIAALARRTRPDGSGVVVSDISVEATERKVAWVREAAGERFDSIELNSLIFAVEVTDDAQSGAEQLAARFGITPADALASPHVLVGPVERMVDAVLEWRQRSGISYFVVQQEIETFAPVLARLAGS